MQSLAERFYEIGEPYAGGLFEQPGRGPFYRYARAQRMFWERQQMPEYLGGKLYPADGNPEPARRCAGFLLHRLGGDRLGTAVRQGRGLLPRHAGGMGAPADAEAPARRGRRGLRALHSQLWPCAPGGTGPLCRAGKRPAGGGFQGTGFWKFSPAYAPITPVRFRCWRRRTRTRS